MSRPFRTFLTSLGLVVTAAVATAQQSSTPAHVVIAGAAPPIRLQAGDQTPRARDRRSDTAPSANANLVARITADRQGWITRSGDDVKSTRITDRLTYVARMKRDPASPFITWQGEVTVAIQK